MWESINRTTTKANRFAHSWNEVFGCSEGKVHQRISNLCQCVEALTLCYIYNKLNAAFDCMLKCIVSFPLVRRVSKALFKPVVVRTLFVWCFFSRVRYITFMFDSDSIRLRLMIWFVCVCVCVLVVRLSASDIPKSLVCFISYTCSGLERIFRSKQQSKLIFLSHSNVIGTDTSMPSPSREVIAHKYMLIRIPYDLKATQRQRSSISIKLQCMCICCVPFDNHVTTNSRFFLLLLLSYLFTLM